LLLAACCSLLTAHCSLRTAHSSLLTSYLPLTAFCLLTYYQLLTTPYDSLLLLDHPKQAGSTLTSGRLPQLSTAGKGLLGLPKLPFHKERVPGEPAVGAVVPSKQLKALL
jgi:hypothetical protein